MILDRHYQAIKAAQPRVVNDLPSDIELSDDDVKTIVDALNKSRWLRSNIRSLYKLYKWLPRLEAGYYDDYKTAITNSAFGVFHEYTEAELNSFCINITEED